MMRMHGWSSSVKPSKDNVSLTSRKLSLSCVWLLLSRLRSVSSYLHFQVWLIFSRDGTKYGRVFHRILCKTPAFLKTYIFQKPIFKKKLMFSITCIYIYSCYNVVLCTDRGLDGPLWVSVLHFGSGTQAKVFSLCGHRMFRPTWLEQKSKDWFELLQKLFSHILSDCLFSIWIFQSSISLGFCSLCLVTAEMSCAVRKPGSLPSHPRGGT